MPSLRPNLAWVPQLYWLILGVNSKTILATDASRLKGLAFVLLQLVNGVWRPVQAGSRFATPTKSRYVMIELEALAELCSSATCTFSDYTTLTCLLTVNLSFQYWTPWGLQMLRIPDLSALQWKCCLNPLLHNGWNENIAWQQTPFLAFLWTSRHSTMNYVKFMLKLLWTYTLLISQPMTCNYKKFPNPNRPTISFLELQGTSTVDGLTHFKK